MGDLLTRSQRGFVLDRGMPSCLPERLAVGTPTIGESALAHIISPQDVAKMCQQQHRVFITACEKYAFLPAADSRATPVPHAA
jgi:hypothetical protein